MFHMVGCACIFTPDDVVVVCFFVRAAVQMICTDTSPMTVKYEYSPPPPRFVREMLAEEKPPHCCGRKGFSHSRLLQQRTAKYKNTL